MKGRSAPECRDAFPIRNSKLRILFLQGPAGPLFARLGARLAGLGHDVRRVNFNAGDQQAWRLPGAVSFRRRAAAWPAVCERLMASWRITDVVLFGDCRPMHSAAIAIARRLGVRVHVLEEGYIRPNWVTLERDGVNGHSSLPRDPQFYLRHSDCGALPVPPAPVPYSFPLRARYDIVYNLSSIAGAIAYPFARTHRPWHPLVEYAGWVRRLLGTRWERLRASAEEDRLRRDGRPFFLFPLQLDCDYQVRVHSATGGVGPALDQVLSSFARHAPADILLAIKQHPLENGLRNWRAHVAKGAARLGIAGRVFFLEVGNLAALLTTALGMVTINSTSGMDALAAGVPLIALGQAIYRIPGLCSEVGLDRFWVERTPPDPVLTAAFRQVVARLCLVPGGFHSESGMAMLVDSVAARLESMATISPGRAFMAVPRVAPNPLTGSLAAA